MRYFFWRVYKYIGILSLVPAEDHAEFTPNVHLELLHICYLEPNQSRRKFILGLSHS